MAKSKIVPQCLRGVQTPGHQWAVVEGGRVSGQFKTVPDAYEAAGEDAQIWYREQGSWDWRAVSHTAAMIA